MYCITVFMLLQINLKINCCALLSRAPVAISASTGAANPTIINMHSKVLVRLNYIERIYLKETGASKNMLNDGESQYTFS